MVNRVKLKRAGLSSISSQYCIRFVVFIRINKLIVCFCPISLQWSKLWIIIKSMREGERLTCVYYLSIILNSFLDYLNISSQTLGPAGLLFQGWF